MNDKREALRRLRASKLAAVCGAVVAFGACSPASKAPSTMTGVDAATSSSSGSGGSGNSSGGSGGSNSAGGCMSSGSITAVLQDQTVTWDCFGVVGGDTGGRQLQSWTGTGANGGILLSIDGTDSAPIKSGDSIPFGVDGGPAQAVFTISALLSDAGTRTTECVATSGSLTVNPWSTTFGNQVGFAIPTGTPIQCNSQNILGFGGGQNLVTFTGTVNGSVTAPLY